MTLVKVTTQHPRWPFERQTPQSARSWGENHFAIGDETRECDWWVVCEGLIRDEVVTCPVGNRIFITWEPPSRVPAYDATFLSQFDVVLSPHRDLPHPRVVHGLQGHPWFVNRTYDQLVELVPEPDKQPIVSIVTSNKVSLPGHRRRLATALALKEELGDRAVLLGRGFREFEDKWDALAPYRYTVAIENDIAEDYATEKLFDCFLAWTVPFYAGCLNVASYFPQQSFEPIDLDDVVGTARRIEAALDDPTDYDSRIAALSEARIRCLNSYNLFPLVGKLIEHLSNDGAPLHRKTTVVHPEFRRAPLYRRVAGRIAWEARGRRQPPAGAKPRWWWEVQPSQDSDRRA